MKSATDLALLAPLARDAQALAQERAENPAPMDDEDLALAALAAQLREKVAKAVEASRPDALARGNSLLADFQASLARIAHANHVQHAYADPTYQALLALAEHLPAADGDGLRAQAGKLIHDRLSALGAQEDARRKEGEDRARERLAALQSLVGDVALLLEKSCSTPADVDLFRKENELSVRVVRDAQGLPGPSRQRVLDDLADTFARRKRSLELSRTDFVRTDDLVDFGGGVKVPVFPDAQRQDARWKLNPVPAGDEVRITYENQFDDRIEPSLDKQLRPDRPFLVSRERYAQLLGGAKKLASTEGSRRFAELQAKGDAGRSAEENREFSGLRDDAHFERVRAKLPKKPKSHAGLVPSVDPRTVVGPTTRKFLSEFSALVEQQERASGILIVESDAGTGKNFKADLYAHYTNRPVFEFSANKQTEKSDLLFSREIGNEGTYRVASNLIRGIQTPGAIVVIDEVNTLPPGVAKLLNSLLDGRRYLNDPRSGKIRAHPSVRIVGLMNPRSYLGTNPLSQEIVSRARIMQDEYPAEFEEGEDGKKIPSWEEAFMVSRHLPEPMCSIDEGSFRALWKKFVVDEEKPGAEGAAAVRQLKALRRLVAFANVLRNEYREGQRGDSAEEEPLKFIFSLREGAQVAHDLRVTAGDWKKSVARVVLPKLTTEAEKKRVRAHVEKYLK